MSFFKPLSLFIHFDTASLKIEYERSSFPIGKFGKLFTNQADMKLSHNLDNMVFIRAALLSFLVAGYDTTRKTLSWTSYQLAKNPDPSSSL